MTNKEIMSDQDNGIFKQEGATTSTPEVNSTTSTTSPSPLSDLLQGIKNDRGEQKYKSPEDALVALQHSQTHIPKLEGELTSTREEMQQLKDEVTRLKSIEEVVEKLTSSQSQVQEQPPANTGLTEAQIAELVNTTITRQEQAKTANQNQQAVVSALKEMYGDRASEVFYSQAAELGMDEVAINDMAARSPKAVYKMLGIGQEKKTTPAPTTSSVNTSGFTPNTETFIGRNRNSIGLGATTQDFDAEQGNARKMVEELHKQGLSIHDLTDPKVFFSQFK